MNFVVKKICENGVRVVGTFNNHKEALEKKQELLDSQEFSECFIEIIAPEGFQLAGAGA